MIVILLTARTYSRMLMPIALKKLQEAGVRRLLSYDIAGGINSSDTKLKHYSYGLEILVHRIFLVKIIQ